MHDGILSSANHGDSATIGIASTITACGKDRFTEGAAIMKYSVDQTSIHGNKGGKYEYKFYIFYHPDAIECTSPLKDLGFELVESPTPLNVSDIRGEVLRDRIVNNGCCGERELVKLEAFKLIGHPIVIHLDLDVLVLEPMDPAIDLMMHPQRAHLMDLESFVMWPERAIPPEIDLMFTKDYNVVGPGRKDKPFQGGFFMIKPSLNTYREFVEIVLEGDYRNNTRTQGGTGWGGIVGPFHGGMTIQGLLPWYYEYLRPGRAVELNRCVYNNMADNPTTKEAVNDTAQGHCRTNQEVSPIDRSLSFLSPCGTMSTHFPLFICSYNVQTCEDCRNRNITDIITFHFTICLKPWGCFPQANDVIEQRLCHKAHHEWFRYRHDLEVSWGRNGTGPKTYRAAHFFGNCEHAFKNGYHPIQTPYGPRKRPR